MKHTLLAAIALAAGLSGCTSSQTPAPGAVRGDSTDQECQPVAAEAPVAAAEAPAQPPEPEAMKVVRLSGDPSLQAEFDGKNYRCGPYIVNEHLPEGYPAPTPPGTIELKDYPSVRRAEFRGNGASNLRASGGFWPLFFHIKRRNIAMTSPVEMDYGGVSLDESGASSSGDVSWTMSFLYRSNDLGPTGEDGNIEVVDTIPVKVIAVGLVGSPSQRVINDGAKALREFFASQSEWEPAGELRGLFYNGPDIPERRKWAEVQVPVRRATDR